MAYRGKFHEDVPLQTDEKRSIDDLTTAYNNHPLEDVSSNTVANQDYYKPFVLRAPFLSSILLLILVYITLLEVAGHHYPRYDASLSPTLLGYTNTISHASTQTSEVVVVTITTPEPRAFIARRQHGFTTSTRITTTSSSLTTDHHPVVDTSTSLTSTTSYTTTPLPSPVHSHFLNPDPGTISTPSTRTSPLVAVSSKYLDPNPSGETGPHYSPEHSVYLNPNPHGPTSSSASSETSGTTTVIASPEDTSFLPPNPNNGNSPSGAAPQRITSTVYVPPTDAAHTTSPAQTSASKPAAVTPASLVSITTNTRGSILSSSDSSTVATARPTQQGQESGEGNDIGASDNIGGSSSSTQVFNQPLQSTFLATDATSSPQSTAYPQSQSDLSAGSANDDEEDNSNSFFIGSLVRLQQVPDTTRNISHGDYFIGSYLLVLAAILLRILYSQVYNALRLMEPFYQLGTLQGALGRDVMSSLYLSNGFTPEVVRSSRAKQWVIAWASSIGLVLDIFVSVASETLLVDDQHCHQQRTDDPSHPCFPRVVVRAAAFRVAEVMLALMFLGLLGLALFNLKRKSGVFADPSCIAYMTSLLHHSHVVEQFRLLDPFASSSEVCEELSKDRYRLAHYHTTDGALRYGLVPANNKYPTSDSEDDFKSPSPMRRQTTLRIPTRTLTDREKSKAKELALRYWGDASLLIVITVILALVGRYWTDRSNDGYNDFMNAGGFGPRFIFTLVGTVTVALWRRTERETRTQAPYHRLLKGTSAKPLLTVNRSSPWTTFPTAIKAGSIFTAFVAFNAILSELLTVALSGVPFSASNYLIGYVVSTWTSISILGVMGIAALMVPVRRKFGPKFPRPPETLASVWSYVAGSYMRTDFEDLSMMSHEEMERRVRGWGKSYVFGEGQGVDGQKRFLVDEQFE